MRGLVEEVVKRFHYVNFLLPLICVTDNHLKQSLHLMSFFSLPQGTFFNDLLLSVFCDLCALVQEAQVRSYCSVSLCC